MPQNRDLVKLRLTRKFAQFIDGIDLSRVAKGEEVVLTEGEATLLIAEGWAEPLDVAADAAPTKPRQRTPKKKT